MSPVLFAIYIDDVSKCSKFYRYPYDRVVIDLVIIYERLEVINILIPWVDEMRYLGLFIVRSHTFKCSLGHAKRSFYRAVNGIFGRIWRTAPEEVILELIKSNCFCCTV